MGTMDGKCGMITGGASGIGLAVLEEMLKRGASVVAADIKSSPELDALIAQYGNDRVRYVMTDVSNPKALEEACKVTAELGGGNIDFLINNAGIQIQKPISEQTPETFQKLIGINLMGKAYGTMAALPYMKGEDGVIINTSSVHGHVGSDERGPYCAAMHGTIGLTKTTAADLAKDNIRVYSVSPAFIDTPLAQGPLEDLVEKGRFKNYEEAKEWRLQYQGNKWISMEDTVAAYADLLDGTNRAPTGQDILLDNGYVRSANERNGGMAIFEDEAQSGVDRINAGATVPTQLDASNLTHNAPQNKGSDKLEVG
ncbi:MAG: SDR family oxidoreductase [Rickettsiales bacterium]|nr:SDR family oxidoreductase [Rickettsiales bacterium]